MNIVYVIPCSAEKLDRPVPAAEMYVGSMFRHTLAHVGLLAGKDRGDGHTVKILILSAWYGLITLDRVIEPYDVRMPEVYPDEQLPQLVAQIAQHIEPDDEVCAFLPDDYWRPFAVACGELYIYPMPGYEGCAGIGDQRHVNAVVSRNEWQDGDDDGPGPRVWVGADASSLMWGIPVLISYGRLRKAKRLHRAVAPWVCDSRGFNEIMDH